MKNQGFNHVRLNDPINADELAFAKMWEKLNNRKYIYPSVLNHIVGSKSDDRHFNPTEQDIAVAASVIQWLGTTVGKGFLAQVFIDNPELYGKIKSMVG